jgi:hypothetical protein
MFCLPKEKARGRNLSSRLRCTTDSRQRVISFTLDSFSIKGAANLFLQVEGKSADGEAVLWDDPQ